MRTGISWILALLLIALVAWRLDYLYQPLPQSVAADPEAETLFDALLDTGFIQLDEDQSIILPTEDQVMALQAANPQANPNEHARWDMAQDRIDTLYYRPVGSRIRQQVKLWNHTRRIAAIRDNRTQDNDINQWKVSAPSGQHLDRLNLVPLEFGYVAVNPQLPKLLAGFHDWGGATHRSNTLIFSSEFNLKSAQTIRLQIVGQPDVSQLKRLGIRFKHYPRYSPKLSRKCRPDTADAHELVLQLAAGKQLISLPVKNVPNPNPAVDGLALSLSKSNDPQTNRARSTHKCTKPTYTAAQLNWNTGNLKNPDTGAGLGDSLPYYIRTSDKVDLTDSDAIGKASDFTVNNGLLALVGQDQRDVYSLSGLLSRSRTDKTQELTLTLDSRWQQSAQHVLAKSLKRHPLKKEQRMSIVVMEPDSGKILAAASVPTPPRDVHSWDRNAYSQLFPKDDPYRFTPWQGLTGDNAPGSTFKTVTALAALKAAEKSKGLTRVLQGIPLGQVPRTLGMNTNTATWQPPNGVPSVSNALAYETFEWASRKPLYSCPGSEQRSGRPGQIGLHLALSQSLNTWFSRIAVLMDAKNIKKTTRNSELVKMSQQLGFGSIYNLWPDVIPLKRRHAPYTFSTDLLGDCRNDSGQANTTVCKERIYLGSGDVLNGFTGNLDLASQQRSFGSGYRSKLNRLVRASYGQAMSATPLQIATLASTISTGKLTKPRLIGGWNGLVVKYPKTAKLEVANLDWLRDGMKSVTERGTAVYSSGAIFKGKHQCQVYGKTGTADVGSGKGTHRTAWFMGWLNDDANKPKVAFSCMVTHAPGSGGAVCAPLISELLKNTVALHGVKP